MGSSLRGDSWCSSTCVSGIDSWIVNVPSNELGAPDSLDSARAREHLANERTLLAWIRTAITLMGLGFVVARFGLFLRELALQRSGVAGTDSSISSAVGIAFIVAGIVAAVLGASRFLRASRQIDQGRFEPELFAEVTIVVISVLGGLVLVGYLALNQ